MIKHVYVLNVNEFELFEKQFLRKKQLTKKNEKKIVLKTIKLMVYISNLYS